MSDIQTIIELIEKGYRNGDCSQGQRQINDALFILRKMQEDSHLHSGQRWELSQILECGPLYGDIEKAARETKAAQARGWLSMDSAPKDGTKVFLRGGMQADTDIGDEQEAARGIAVCWWHDGFWRFACYDGGYLGIWEGATGWKHLSALNDECGWQPIETAPKDGTEVFLCSSEEHFPAASLCKDGYAEGFYQGLNEEDGDGDVWLVYDKRPDGDFFIVKPTHWTHKIARPPFNTNHLVEPE